jgi:hypothetical protein
MVTDYAARRYMLKRAMITRPINDRRAFLKTRLRIQLSQRRPNGGMWCSPRTVSTCWSRSAVDRTWTIRTRTRMSSIGQMSWNTHLRVSSSRCTPMEFATAWARRQQSQCRHETGHHDGAKPQDRSLHSGIDDAVAACTQLVDVFQHDHSGLHTDAKECCAINRSQYLINA